MTNAHFHPSNDTLTAFLLEELDPSVHDEVDRHIEGCDACLREHAATAETLAAIALAAPPVMPSATLRDRVLAAATTAPARAPARRPAIWSRRWGRRLVPVALVAAIAAAVIVTMRPTTPPARVAAFSNAAGTLRVGGGSAQVASFALAPAPPGRSYELWVLRPGAAPRAAGLVRAGDHPTLADVHPGDQVAVTVEPAAGSAVPTSAPVAVASVT
jgi:anti-sigma-K factor RskA